MMPGERAEDSGADDTAASRPSPSRREDAAPTDGQQPTDSATPPRTSVGAAAAALSAVATGRSAAPHGGPDAPDGEDGREARRAAWRGLDQGSVMTVELLTATLVWFGIGWLIDTLLGTMPWFMFAGALLGNWVGLYLLWLRGQRAEESERGNERPTPAGADQRADR